MRWLAVLVLCACTDTFDRSRIPTEIEAIGFGAAASGAGDDGVDCVVSTLADSGEGSLRACVSSSGARVRFDVGGVVELRRELDFGERITLDGTTAPAPVVLRGAGLGVLVVLDRPNVVLRGIRLEPDGGQGGGVGISVGPTERIRIEGVVFAGGRRAMAIGAARNVTVSDSWFHQMDSAINVEQFTEAERGENVTIARSVFSQCSQQLPRVKGGQRNVQVVDTVIFGWDRRDVRTPGLLIATGEGAVGAPEAIDLVGIRFVRDPSAGAEDERSFGLEGVEPSAVAVQDIAAVEGETGFRELGEVLANDLAFERRSASEVLASVRTLAANDEERAVFERILASL